MYGMFTNISNISPKIDPNVGKYSIHGHGACGYAKLGFCIIFPPQLELFNPINSAKARSDANLWLQLRTHALTELLPCDVEGLGMEINHGTATFRNRLEKSRTWGLLNGGFQHPECSWIFYIYTLMICMNEMKSSPAALPYVPQSNHAVHRLSQLRSSRQRRGTW